MPRSWSIASRNKVTEPARPAADTTRFRSSDRAIDLKKLLEVYDDYPVVVSSLEHAHDALDRAEEDARQAGVAKEAAEGRLVEEKEGRDDDRKQADKDQKAAIKRTDEKVRAELDPKIKNLEQKLKTMTSDRDSQKRDLESLRGKMDGWIASMDRLHQERMEGEAKEVKAAEERQRLADKLKTLDEEILEGLRTAHLVNSTEPVTSQATRTAGPKRIDSELSANRSEKTSKKADRFAEHDW